MSVNVRRSPGYFVAPAAPRSWDDRRVIIVTALVRLQSDRLAEATTISLEHVLRSRAEPGCISHAVYQDVEDPLTLHFFERWKDRDALVVHFAVPESIAFAKALARLTTERPEIRIYEAEATRI